MNLLPQIRSLIETPVGAGAIIAAFNRLGSWLDGEVEDEQKAALRTYLKSGLWIEKYQSFIEFLLSVYNRVYGTSVLSSKSTLRAVQLSALPFVIICGWASLIGGHLWFLLSWETLVFGLLPRFFLSVIADFANIAGSRLSLYGLRAGYKFLWNLSIILLDFLRAVILVIVTNVSSLWIFQALYAFYLTNSFKKALQATFLNDLSPAELHEFFKNYCVSLFNLNEMDSFLSLTSMIPTALTVIVALATLLRRLIDSFPIAVRPHAADLQYTKPFTLILSIAGVVASAIYLILAGILRHWI